MEFNCDYLKLIYQTSGTIFDSILDLLEPKVLYSLARTSKSLNQVIKENDRFSFFRKMTQGSVKISLMIENILDKTVSILCSFKVKRSYFRMSDDHDSELTINLVKPNQIAIKAMNEFDSILNGWHDEGEDSITSIESGLEGTPYCVLEYDSGLVIKCQVTADDLSEFYSCDNEFTFNWKFEVQVKSEMKWFLDWTSMFFRKKQTFILAPTSIMIDFVANLHNLRERSFSDHSYKCWRCRGFRSK